MYFEYNYNVKRIMRNIYKMLINYSKDDKHKTITYFPNKKCKCK